MYSIEAQLAALPVPLRRTITLQAEYRAFDALPRELRDAINNLPIGIVATVALQCLAALREGGTETEVLQKLRDLDQQLFRRSPQ